MIEIVLDKVVQHTRGLIEPCRQRGTHTLCSQVTWAKDTLHTLRVAKPSGDGLSYGVLNPIFFEHMLDG